MPRLAIIAVLALLVAAPKVAAQDQNVGPWAGIVSEGEVDALWFQNYKSGFACPDLPSWAEPYRPYTFTLTYAAPTDTLRLHVGGLTATGEAGVAILDYVGYICQRGFVYVEGVEVLETAAYVLTVVQGPQEGTLPECSVIC